MQLDFTQPGQRARVHPAQVVGDLHQRHGGSLELAGHRHGGVLRADQGEQVLPRDKFDAGQRGQLLAEARGEFRVGIDASTYGSAALGQRLQAWQGGL
ncbi:hypothetical protein D3C79_538870 [compost metagenome]